MSGPAVMAVVQFVSTAYAAKTMIDGISEGNLAKAIIGGVGAYMGMSSLATTAETSVLNAGESIAEKTAAEAAQSAGQSASTEAAKQSLGTEIGGSAASQGITQAGTAGVQQGGGVAANVAGGSGGGMLSKLGDWATQNQQLAYGGMQLAGGMLAGSAQQDWQEQQLAEMRQREDEARERRGYWAPSPTVGKTRFNPRTGQFEEVAI